MKDVFTRKHLFGTAVTLSSSIALSLSLFAGVPGYAFAEDSANNPDMQMQPPCEIAESSSTATINVSKSSFPAEDTSSTAALTDDSSLEAPVVTAEPDDSDLAKEATSALSPVDEPTGVPDEPAENSADSPSSSSSTVDAQDVVHPAKAPAAPAANTETTTAATGWGTLSDGRTCYYDANGNPLTGEQQLTAEDGTSHWYYFDANGAMITSSWHTWADGTRSYFGGNGAAISGIQSLAGKTYYFDPKNENHSARWTRTINGKMYYFNGAGVMKTGWLTWNSDKSRSYFGRDGAALSGWMSLNDQRYYISPETFRTVRWTQTINGKQYYFNGAYQMRTGWLTWNSDKSRSYFGRDGVALSGFATIGGKTYYFDPKNENHSARWTRTINGKMYYFNGAGVMKTGWLTWNSDKSRSYFGRDGAALSGWKNDGSKRYYIDPSTFHTVRWTQSIAGKQYYFNGAYVMQTGAIKFKKTGLVRLYASDGAQVTEDGFTKVNGYTYYLVDLTPVHGDQTIDGKQYYFNSKYRMHTGWRYISATKKWVFYGTDGVKVNGKLGWTVSADGKTYYFYSGTGSPTHWSKYVYLAWRKIQNMASKTKYIGAIDQAHTYTSFFIRQNGIWAPYKSWLCSVGSSYTPTPKGTFKVWYRSPHQYYTNQKGNTYSVWYWTNWGPHGEAFHSVLCFQNTKKNAWSGLGQHNSGGCVRSPLGMAKWANANVKNGTTIYSF